MTAGMPHHRPWLPWLLIVALLISGAVLALRGDLSWPALAARQADLRAFVGVHGAVAALAYCALYAALVAVSFPGAALITVLGGVFFGTLPGALLAVLGASGGATLLFIVARGALAPLLRRRIGPRLDRLRPGLERDGFAYILALRLLPVVPFWLVNLAAALSGARLGHFVAATLLGTVPAALVFASIGAGLGDVLATDGAPDLRMIFRPSILLPLLGLALLAVLPVLWRQWGRGDGGV